MQVKVSPKYQVVIPESVRNALNLKVGARVEVIAKGGVAYIVPVRSLDEIQTSLHGKLDAEDSQNLRDKKDR